MTRSGLTSTGAASTGTPNATRIKSGARYHVAACKPHAQGRTKSGTRPTAAVSAQPTRTGMTTSRCAQRLSAASAGSTAPRLGLALSMSTTNTTAQTT